MKYGIDTSRWQNSGVDYYKAKLNGVEFVFLRIGAGKSKDSCFEADYAAARRAGLLVGVYFYTYSIGRQGGLEDATRVLGWLNNRKLDFPVALDVEDKRQKDTSMRKMNTEMYLAFKEKIEAGRVYDAMLYTGEYFFNNYFDKKGIDDDLWIAKYSPHQPRVGKTVSIWQFASKHVETPYYVGKLDQNYMLVDSFKASREPVIADKGNPYPAPERTLKRTNPVMSGNDVKWLQYELNEAGYKLVVDGKFGNATKNAVLDYQRKHGLQVDGKVGPATRYSLINSRIY